MPFVIQEIQTNDNVSVLLPAITKQDKNEAESAWHNLMAAAAISSVQVHTVVMYDEHGNMRLNGYYEHIPEAENVAE